MNAEDFEKQAAWITVNLSGKTIIGASFKEYGMGYSIQLSFTDGTKAEISPEYDEGFKFKMLAHR